jgi:ABC-type glutathione transport system ATPase component
MAPSAAGGSGKRKQTYDDTRSPDKRRKMYMSPELTEVDADSLNEVVHNGSKEPFPQRPAYDKGLYSLYKKNQKLVNQLLKVLKPHASVSKELQNMLAKAEEAMELPVPERVMVALVGGTGAGKSNLSLRLTLC